MRQLLVPILALSLTTASAAFAATPTHKGATKAEDTKSCATLTSQFDKAVDNAKATKSALKKARAERTRAASYCSKGQPAKGVAQLRAALAKIGQRPQV